MKLHWSECFVCFYTEKNLVLGRVIARRHEIVSHLYSPRESGFFDEEITHSVLKSDSQ